MREVGIRELKQSLSKTLRSVAAGEQVRVTLHGRALADIVPAGARSDDDQLRELVAEGRLSPASRARPERSPRLVRARRSASAIVLADRDAER
jgi:prevent-host-death family protein